MVRWNLNGSSTKAMLYARNIGNMKITDLNGNNECNNLFDIDAANLSILSRRVRVASDILSPRTNMFW
jgi:hypothetical protein